MNKQANSKNVRPATLPTPQGNQQPRLLDAQGNEKPTAPPIEMSLDLSIFRLDIPAEGDDVVASRSGSSDDDSTDQLSFGRAALLEARQNANGSLSDFIEYCETAYKGLKKAAEALIEPHIPAYLAWAKQFRPTQNIAINHKSVKGAQVTLTPENFDDSVETIFWLMAKISNSKLFGKPATKSKAAVPSIFYNPKAVSKLAGFEGKSEKVRAMANVEYLIVDQSGDIEYFFTQLGDLARYVLHNNAVEANNIWRKLTGKVVADQRVVFPEKFVNDSTQARMYGSLAALFAEEARKAKEKKYKLALSDVEEARLTEYREKVLKPAINKAADDANKPKIEKIGDSKVESTDTKATLPQATVAPKTLEEIEHNRALKQAASEAQKLMNDQITLGKLDVNDIDACNEYWDEQYNAILIQRGLIVATEEEEETSTDDSTDSTEEATS